MIWRCAIYGTRSTARAIHFVSNAWSSDDLLALDFDGVICASSGESSYSAVLAAKNLWPSSFQGIEENSDEFDCIKRDLMKVRPVIETGFENVLLARYFLDRNRISSELPDHNWDTETLLSLYSTKFRDYLLDFYETPKAELVRAFGNARDEMVALDPHAWATKNVIYPHIYDSISHLSYNTAGNSISLAAALSKVFIVTTKQERFVRYILDAFEIPLYRQGLLHCDVRTRNIRQDEWWTKTSNVFDLENIYGVKLNVLKELSLRMNSKTGDINKNMGTIHFVEDRYETLTKIISEATIDQSISLWSADHANLQTLPGRLRLRLYLVDWGYNTVDQRSKAVENPCITLITPRDFVKMVKVATKAFSS